jgi:hypothetical protein
MWITTTFVDLQVGTAFRSALAPSTASFNQYELSARSFVESVLQYAGYASPGTALTDGTIATAFLRKLTVAQWCREASAYRPGIEFPKAIADDLALLQSVYDKRLPVPGSTPTSDGGYGATLTSPTTGPNARPQVFAPSKMTGW